MLTLLHNATKDFPVIKCDEKMLSAQTDHVLQILLSFSYNAAEYSSKSPFDKPQNITHDEKERTQTEIKIELQSTLVW